MSVSGTFHHKISVGFPLFHIGIFAIAEISFKLGIPGI